MLFYHFYKGIHGIGAVTALEVLSVFTATPEKEGETTRIMSILSSLRKFREWWANKSVVQRLNALRSKLKNITISEDFPNARVCKIIILFYVDTQSLNQIEISTFVFFAFQVVEAYLFPTVDENRESFSWGKLEVESIHEYAKKTFGWTRKRTDEIILPVVKRLSEKTSQQSIQNYFKITSVTSRKDLQVSKRVRVALQHMSGDPDSSLVADEAVEKKKPRKKTTKKKATSKTGDVDDTSGADNIDAENSQKDQMEQGKSKPKGETKPRRKRKVAEDSEQKQQQENNDAEPGTSTAAPKKIVLPDNPITAPIPQREKEKQIMENNRLKAIQLLKKVKMNKKK